MPQYRRKVAFSCKKKKVQLKEKRVRVQTRDAFEDQKEKDEREKNYVAAMKIIPKEEAESCQTNFSRVYQQEVENLGGSTDYGRNRYQLQFKKDTEEDKINRQKKNSEPIICLEDVDLESKSEHFYPEGLDYPKRPEWKFGVSKAEFNQNENRYFRKFCEEIDINFYDCDMSKYELNIETWRQLWRVVEKSDILVIVVDARYPTLHFPPYLYDDIVNRRKKDVILVLNKSDLLPPQLVLAWQRYFREKFPNLSVVPFCSLEGVKCTRGLLKMAKHSSLKLVEACEKFINNEVDISSWKRKIEIESSYAGKPAKPKETVENNEYYAPKEHTKYENGILTIGTIGHPNVGKSSLINALMGKKVVSVSRTPGHTKHFQTIYITNTVQLCDCPGLVFPSVCPTELQVLAGSYPIAQFRNPLSVVNYIGTHINLPKRLNIEGMKEKEYSDCADDEWSAYDIANSWAERRRYFIKTKCASPDVYRAGNEILRFALSGLKNINVYLKPPNYQNTKTSLLDDPEVKEIQLIQGLKQSTDSDISDFTASDDSSDSESEEPKETESEGRKVSSIEKSSKIKKVSFKTKSQESDEEKEPIATSFNKFSLLEME